jgi:hypothetical protein
MRALNSITAAIATPIEASHPRTTKTMVIVNTLELELPLTTRNEYVAIATVVTIIALHEV